MSAPGRPEGAYRRAQPEGSPLSADDVLQVQDLRLAFGGIVAVDGVSLSIRRGEVVGIIGANGAGKTTFVNMITGWVRPSSGRIALNGRDVAGQSSRAMARSGVTRSFQIPQVFAHQSVAQNMALALGLADDRIGHLLRPMATAQRQADVDATLARFKLQHWADRLAAELPQGARKLLDIAMALARRPELLLLDEPTSGVPREEKFALMDQVLAALAGSTVTVLFVEHDMEVVMRHASRVIAFVQGRVIADGSCAEVLADAAVREHVIGHGVAVPAIA